MKREMKLRAVSVWIVALAIRGKDGRSSYEAEGKGQGFGSWSSNGKVEGTQVCEKQGVYTKAPFINPVSLQALCCVK